MTNLRLALTCILCAYGVFAFFEVGNTAIELEMISPAFQFILYGGIFAVPFYLLRLFQALPDKPTATWLVSGAVLTALIITFLPHLLSRNIRTMQFPRALRLEESEDLRRRLGFPVSIETLSSGDQEKGETVRFSTEVAFRRNYQHQTKLEEELNRIALEDKERQQQRAEDKKAAAAKPSSSPSASPSLSILPAPANPPGSTIEPTRTAAESPSPGPQTE